MNRQKKKLMGMYITILRIRLKSTMMTKRKKMTTSRCMKKMITNKTKTKKMKMKAIFIIFEYLIENNIYIDITQMLLELQLDENNSQPDG